MKRTIAGATVALCALALASGCATSSYQSAKMLQPGETRFTAALSNYQAHTDGGSSGEPAYELSASYGMNPTFEIGGKVSVVDHALANAYTLLAVPKFSIVPDEIAIVVPAGLAVLDTDEDSDHGYVIMPGLVYTRQLNPDFELDLTGQLVVGTNNDFDDSDQAIGANVGLQLSPGGAAWALHPEIGLLIPFGDTADSDVDYFLQFGFAFHYRFGGPGAEAAPAPMASR
jgi:hypothetical protein